MHESVDARVVAPLLRASVESLEGEIAFLSPEEQAQRSIELLGNGALVVTLPPPVVAARGRLGELLEELVERELARLGAASPYLAAWSATTEDASLRLGDQLERARSVGGTGIALALGTLAAIARPSLTTDDSAILRWLADATLHLPLVLLLDDGDLGLHGWSSPIPLVGLLSRPRITISATAPVVWEEPAELPDVIELTPSALLDAEEIEDEPSVILEDVTQVDARVMLVEAVDPRPSVAPEELAVLAQEAEEAAAPESSEPEALAVAEPIALVEPAADDIPVVVAPVVEEPAPVVEAAPEPEPPVAPARRPRRRLQLDPERARERATVGVPVVGPDDAWRQWAIALGAAKGAQPPAAFERIFTQSYIPLSGAIAAGLEDPRALRAYDEFRRSFERSYTDAFATFGATNRRPRLVMDAYDLAVKHARLVNARQTHVLVVDSMRYDLGCLVRDAVIRETNGIATLGTEMLLWSALPSTTIRQLETLARGIDALRAPSHEEPAESLRGRAAEVVRRVRLGTRELYKLDIIPAHLDEMAMGTWGGGEQPEPGVAFQRIADACADSLARHISTLQPRTYLFVIGDHGFAIDRRGAVQLGGASPEEVLVPAFGFLVGDLH